MKIEELFAKRINRAINGVIKADQRDAESIWQELDEYVATKEVTEYLRSFFDAYLATVDRPNDPSVVARMGVWVSGFFGSGKSHFIKILSYLLSNLEASRPGDGAPRRAIDFFQSKIKDAILLGDIQRAVTGDTDVILFNIDSKAGLQGRARRNLAGLSSRVQRDAGLVGRRSARGRNGALPHLQGRL